MPLILKNPSYYVTIFDSSGNVLVDIGPSGSQFFTGRKRITPPEEMVLQEALKDREIIDTINILNGLQESFPAYIAAHPIKRNDEINGIVMVRFIFSENFSFFSQISRNIAADIAVYVNAEPVFKTADINVTMEQYNDVLFMKKNTEVISFTGLGLNEYRGLYSNNGDAVALLHMHLSSFSYIATLGAAFLIYVILTLIIIIIVSFIVIKVSAGILNPIDILL